MEKKKPNEHDAAAARFEDYLKHGESSAMYMNGLADAWEASGATTAKDLIHHLRCHAEELSMGTLWVRHGYKDPSAGDSK